MEYFELWPTKEKHKNQIAHSHLEANTKNNLEPSPEFFFLQKEKQSNLAQAWTDDFSLRVHRDQSMVPLGTPKERKKKKKRSFTHTRNT
jgi:hypothetical protein